MSKKSVKTSKPKTKKTAKASKPKTKSPSVLEQQLTATPPLTTPVALPVPPTPKLESEKIWDEIRDLPIEMFALPRQFVFQYCDHLPFIVDPNKLYLVIKSSAVLPALETCLNAYSDLTKLQAKELAKRNQFVEVKEYTIELADKFVVVARAANSQLLASYLNR